MKESITDKIFDTFTRLIESENKHKIFLGSDIRTSISFAKKIPEVIELIELGKLSSYFLVSEFMDDDWEGRYKTSNEKDATLSCLACVMKETDYKPAVPVLLNFVRRNWLHPSSFFYSVGISTYAVRGLANLEETKEAFSRAEEIAYTIIGGELWLREHRNQVESMRDDVMKSMSR